MLGLWHNQSCHCNHPPHHRDSEKNLTKYSSDFAFFGFIPPPSLNSEKSGSAPGFSGSLGFWVRRWYFQTERGSNPEPLPSEEVALSTPQTPPLFVFLIDGLKQNVKSLLTPVSGTVFHALSNGSLHFVLHRSLINCLFQRYLLAV